MQEYMRMAAPDINWLPCEFACEYRHATAFRLHVTFAQNGQSLYDIAYNPLISAPEYAQIKLRVEQMYRRLQEIGYVFGIETDKQVFYDVATARLGLLAMGCLGLDPAKMNTPLARRATQRANITIRLKVAGNRCSEVIRKFSRSFDSIHSVPRVPIASAALIGLQPTITPLALAPWTAACRAELLQPMSGSARILAAHHK